MDGIGLGQQSSLRVQSHRSRLRQSLLRIRFPLNGRSLPTRWLQTTQLFLRKGGELGVFLGHGGKALDRLPSEQDHRRALGQYDLNKNPVLNPLLTVQNLLAREVPT